MTDVERRAMLDARLSMTEEHPVRRFMAADHDRLDGLLERALRSPHAVDDEAYEHFRAGLLQHIAMEEKVLFDAVSRADGRPHPDQERLHKDHGFIATMLTYRPTHDIVREIREVLERHNAMEEAANGIYDRCDALGAERAHAVVERMRALPRVKVAPYRRGR